eukprot:jgi/Mesvir1/16840/Mv15733-RA.1
MGKLLCFSLLCIFLVAPATALYSGASAVVQLSPSDFKSRVLQSDGVVIVEFYAPWCGHCKQLAPEYEKAAKALKGVVTVAAVDCDQYKELAGQYGVQGFPTIKIFSAGQKPTDYNGQRTAQAIADAALQAAKSLASQRLGGKAGGGSSSGGGSSHDASASEPGGGEHVVKLTDDNFDELVVNSADVWMVEFYAPWCGHCKSLSKDWAQAARELKGKVKVGAVDCTVQTSLAERFGIRGFPTIKVFAADKSQPSDYQMARTASAIVDFALKVAAENVTPRPVVQVTDAGVMDEHCLSGAQLCILAFVPHILDSGAAGRYAYLDILRDAAEAHKMRDFSFLWAEGGSQPQLEAAVGVGGFGYPAAVAVNPKKGVYVNMKTAFDKKLVMEWMKGVASGREKPVPLEGGRTELPAVATVQLWDGKDAAIEEEDEFDLEELMKDEL